MNGKEYEKAITDEYNKWSKIHDETRSGTTITENGVAAFMCNAIALAVSKSSRKSLREYFAENAFF